ncbi:unnamed protein product [Rotaria sordida]|uniref:Uncharacterized protein n=1 Tax=Rotaria sordida TaxID=392033 RepID=A0A815JI38_9BILA|nr:unnamed protein product [Rotaria sordida]CAF1615657.1 unnamed protein product [Rotaria sordida]
MLFFPDIHITQYKYVRFKNPTEKLNPSKIEELLTTIQGTIENFQTEIPKRNEHTISEQSQKKPELMKSTNFNDRKSIEQWTAKDIASWFSNHKVPDNLIKLYDFQSITEIREYATKLRADSQKEFVKYREQYSKSYNSQELEEYIFGRFKTAVFSLPTASSTSTKTKNSQSSTCIIL